MEIEKKYLLAQLPEGIDEYDKIEIRQAYISTSPVIRIRQAGEKYILTVKGKGTLAKEEFELEISCEEYKSLFKKVDDTLKIKEIHKTRYLIPIGKTEDGFKLTAEVDRYYGALDGFLTVEVEFNTIEQAESFLPPSWFGKDVTDNSRYSNSSLSIDGLPI